MFYSYSSLQLDKFVITGIATGDEGMSLVRVRSKNHILTVSQWPLLMCNILEVTSWFQRQMFLSSLIPQLYINTKQCSNLGNTESDYL